MFELDSKSLSKISLAVEDNWINGNRKLALSLLWFLSSIQCFYVTLQLSNKVQKEIFSFSPTFDICNIKNRRELEKELGDNDVENAYLILTIFSFYPTFDIYNIKYSILTDIGGDGYYEDDDY